MVQATSNSVILAQKKIKSKTKQNQTTEKQTNKSRQESILLSMLL